MRVRDQRRSFLTKLAIGGGALALPARRSAAEEAACKSEIDQALARQRGRFREREMEARARYARPLVGRFGPSVLEEIERVTIAEARRSMQEQKLERRDLEAVITTLWDHLGPEFEYRLVERGDEVLRFQVTRCPLATKMRELDAGEIGLAYYCAYDYGFCQGLNPKIVFERTKTLMQGDDHCDHAYELKKS
jgi:hypothetical protein